jgi:hypothetical protein
LGFFKICKLNSVKLHHDITILRFTTVSFNNNSLVRIVFRVLNATTASLNYIYCRMNAANCKQRHDGSSECIRLLSFSQIGERRKHQTASAVSLRNLNCLQ